MVETIHPGQIESELGRIWESLQGTNKMRACLFNLIIYAQKGKRSTYLRQIAQKVIQKFPSRVIFISYEKECETHALRTSVSVLTADEGENEIACDLIDVEVCSLHQPRIPFVILPHILPDLPVYLVHADAPTDKNPISHELERFASRIIFDSESATDLPAFARAVLKHQKNCSADIADLNWARTEGWRQLFANVFKSQDELERLHQASSIQIHYNSQESNYLHHTNVQSIYLQTWIGAQLGWKLAKVKKTDNLYKFFYHTQFNQVEVSLKPSLREDLPPGRLLSVEINTDCNSHYLFKRSLECPHHVIIEKSSPQSCALPTHFVLDKDISGQSLVKEICHQGTSAHYTQMLAILAEIKNEQLCNE